MYQGNGELRIFQLCIFVEIDLGFSNWSCKPKQRLEIVASYLVETWSSNDKNDQQGKQYESKDKPNDVDDSKTNSNFLRDETSF